MFLITPVLLGMLVVVGTAVLFNNPQNVWRNGDEYLDDSGCLTIRQSASRRWPGVVG
jgi:hypothetical protein